MREGVKEGLRTCRSLVRSLFRLLNPLGYRTNEVQPGREMSVREPEDRGIRYQRFKNAHEAPIATIPIKTPERMGDRALSHKIPRRAKLLRAITSNIVSRLP